MPARHTIGLRREDKNLWERRVPIIPEHVAGLVKEQGLEVLVQPSEVRVIKAAEYLRAGAAITEDLSTCSTVFAVKEIPIKFLSKGKTYIFFSHTIKGQPHNMPMLRRLMQLGCQLIDYEKMTDEKGRRLVFFGKYAGLAGMIDSLWALGRRLKLEGLSTPLAAVKRANEYPDLAAARTALADVGGEIAAGALPAALTPLVIGLTGYGHVSQGAQEILDGFPVEEVKPGRLAALFTEPAPCNKIYKVIFREEDLVEPLVPGQAFELQDYYKNPEKYRSKFAQYLPYLTALINGIYWEARYPRLVTKAWLKKAYAENAGRRLRVIGDITCDIEGSIECNVRSTDIGNPVYVYDPLKDTTADGCAGQGPVVLAVDNLPAELPLDSSRAFSTSLLPFIAKIAKSDMTGNLEDCCLCEPIKKAMILYQGRLTPAFRYLEKFIKE